MKTSYFNKLQVDSLISQIQPFEIDLKIREYKKLKKIRYPNFQPKNFARKVQRLSVSDFRFGKNLDVPSNILRIFQSPEIKIGKIEHIKDFKKPLIEKINYFIKKKKPIEFTILGLPFKAPNPLKTTRRKPDLAELGFILKLLDISRLIFKIYKPGARFIILTEGTAFYDFFKVSKKEAMNHYKYLNRFIEELGISNNIKLEQLTKITFNFSKFRKKYEQNLRKTSREFTEGNKMIRKKITGVLPTLFTSINSRAHSLKDLLDIYNPEIKDEELPIKLRKIRSNLYKSALETGLKYYAFHKTRYDTNFMEETFPFTIRCTLTPKPGSLGIFAINKETKLFPHHGVGVLTRTGKITVKYEADIKRRGNYKAIYIFNEKTPFYYGEI